MTHLHALSNTLRRKRGAELLTHCTEHGRLQRDLRFRILNGRSAQQSTPNNTANENHNSHESIHGYTQTHTPHNSRVFPNTRTYRDHRVFRRSGIHISPAIVAISGTLTVFHLQHAGFMICTSPNKLGDEPPPAYRIIRTRTLTHLYIHTCTRCKSFDTQTHTHVRLPIPNHPRQRPCRSQDSHHRQRRLLGWPWSALSSASCPAEGPVADCCIASQKLQGDHHSSQSSTMGQDNRNPAKQTQYFQ